MTHVGWTKYDDAPIPPNAPAIGPANWEMSIPIQHHEFLVQVGKGWPETPRSVAHIPAPAPPSHFPGFSPLLTRTSSSISFTTLPRQLRDRITREYLGPIRGRVGLPDGDTYSLPNNYISLYPDAYEAYVASTCDPDTLEPWPYDGEGHLVPPRTSQHPSFFKAALTSFQPWERPALAYCSHQMWEEVVELLLDDPAHHHISVAGPAINFLRWLKLNVPEHLRWKIRSYTYNGVYGPVNMRAMMQTIFCLAPTVSLSVRLRLLPQQREDVGKRARSNVPPKFIYELFNAVKAQQDKGDSWSDSDADRDIECIFIALSRLDSNSRHMISVARQNWNDVAQGNRDQNGIPSCLPRPKRHCYCSRPFSTPALSVLQSIRLGIWMWWHR